jgi:hypothetical protein
MKFLLILFALSLLLTACNSHQSDEEIRNKLQGTWLLQEENFKTTTTVSSNGFYVCQTILYTALKGFETNNLEGQWAVKDGFLIDTIMATSETMPTNFHLPYSSRALVIRINDYKLVEKDEQTGAEVVMRKK